jgi:hypothetical protein
MSKSRPISDFIDNEDKNLVEGILNNIDAPVIETNIDDTQKEEQMRMEENMNRQIEEQQRLEHEYDEEEEYHHQDPNQQYHHQDPNQQYHQPQYHPQYQQPHPPVKKEEPPAEKSLIDKILENLKPAIIVIILSSCVFSNVSTKFIENILPDKEIFNKYNIIIVLLIKSLLSGIIFFISNLLL